MGRPRGLSLALCVLALVAACTAVSLRDPFDGSLLQEADMDYQQDYQSPSTTVAATTASATTGPPGGTTEPSETTTIPEDQHNPDGDEGEPDDEDAEVDNEESEADADADMSNSGGLETPAVVTTPPPVEREEAVVDMNVGPGAAPISDFNVVEPEYRMEHSDDIKLLIPGHLPLVLPKGTLITLPGRSANDEQSFDKEQEEEEAKEEALEEKVKEEESEGTETEGEDPAEVVQESQEQEVLDALNTNTNANANANSNSNSNADGYAQDMDTTTGYEDEVLNTENSVEQATENKLAVVAKALAGLEDSDDGYSALETSAASSSTTNTGSLSNEIADAFAAFQS